ncbi:MarR family winged helix-turn-helix transcriptional regulator [Catenisphaera adipataccumulans]|uniref:DNA-binding MarR family transcriptional regulator n=1 Tax=Catenisphaera adipataccumulans TaxID=700500 RepID=A0A7W8CUV8_9FIRM|nr:helix-turn-helix domain-containing protein [Catenisphaera adipataccumulans]MBB5182076.1 DNA-binding MarR family transcriptional regulator [Catenisphaera adipataccumulans]
MDHTIRDITKIAREVSKFTARTMRAEGIGTAEFDFLHVIRKNPGITQAEIRAILGLDKGACARRASSLKAKGYIISKQNPADGRSQLLYATEKADRLKLSKATIEAIYYDWLYEGLSPEDRQTFSRLLRQLYLRNKQESKGGFEHVTERIEKEAKLHE